MATEYQKAVSRDMVAARKALDAARRPVEVAVKVYLQDESAYDGNYKWQATFSGPQPETGKRMDVQVVGLTMQEVLEKAGVAMVEFAVPGAPAGRWVMQDRQEGPVPDELQALATQAMALVAPHEQRVVQEALELQGRLERLTQFVNGQVFLTLDHEDRCLLLHQHGLMSELVVVLAKRIERFRPDAAQAHGLMSELAVVLAKAAQAPAQAQAWEGNPENAWLAPLKWLCLKSYTFRECLFAAASTRAHPARWGPLAQVLHMRAGRGDMDIDQALATVGLDTKPSPAGQEGGGA